MFFNDLFREESSDPTENAQRNLMTRTHYVDPGNLGFHKCRILSSHVVDNGLLFAIVTSDAADFHNTKRVFRYVVFDIFGTVIARKRLEEGYATRKNATKAMWEVLNGIDAIAHTQAEIERQREKLNQHLDYLADKAKPVEKAA